MREGIETVLFVFAILFGPMIAFDLGLNQGRIWRIVTDNTFIDEAFYSVVRFIY